jgi:hypothetical protein
MINFSEKKAPTRIGTMTELALLRRGKPDLVKLMSDQLHGEDNLPREKTDFDNAQDTFVTWKTIGNQGDVCFRENNE